MEKISGIYTITNLIDGKIYVGQTQNLYTRKFDHFKRLNKNIHDNKHLQSAWNKFSKSNFIYEILVECSLDLLSSEEHYWATILNTHNAKYGYNIIPTHPLIGVGRGYTFKMPKASLKKRSIDYRLDENRVRVNKLNGKKASISRIGSHHSLETKIKMKNAKLSSNIIIEITNKKDNSLFNKCELVSQASELTGVKRPAISNNLCGLSKATRKYIFKYKILTNE